VANDGHSTTRWRDHRYGADDDTLALFLKYDGKDRGEYQRKRCCNQSNIRHGLQKNSMRGHRPGKASHQVTKSAIKITATMGSASAILINHNIVSLQ